MNSYATDLPLFPEEPETVSASKTLSDALLVRASAGTGKTYRLVGRLMRLLFDGVNPGTILATTFTRKAAGEILNRILQTLAGAADPSNEQALQDLQRQVNDTAITHQQCMSLLKQLLLRIHQVRIGTLDSLFSQLATSFSYELQMPSYWRLTDEMEETWLTARAVEAMVGEASSRQMQTLLSMLSKGDIKRSVVGEVIQQVTSTYAACRRCPDDVWDQLVAPSKPDQESLQASLDALASFPIPQASLRKALDKVLDLYRDGQVDGLKENTLIANYVKARRTGDPIKFGRSKYPVEIESAFGDLYAAVRSDTLRAVQLQNQATGELLQAYDRQVTGLKQSARTFAFDDIAVRLADRFAETSVEQFVQQLDNPVDHLLLDEFQDTSPLQWQILKTIALSVTQLREDGSRGSFFCVGDTKQAIYGWRGGVAEIFETVTGDLPNVHADAMNISYRSSPVVMHAVNRAFKNMKRHKNAAKSADADSCDSETYVADAIKTFATDFPEHLASRASMPGYVELATCSEESVGEDAEPASIDKHTVWKASAQRIAELNRVAPHLSIGVLTRSNTGVASMITYLESHQVDVSQEGGNPLVDSAAVDLVLSALMMAEHPGDPRWAFHVQHSPLGQLPEITADWVRELVTQSGLALAVEELVVQVAPHCDQRDQDRLSQLVQVAIEHEPNATLRLRDFVQLVRQRRVERPQPAPVRVMTIHQSKGLEFDAVFLIELDQNPVGSQAACVVDMPDLSKPATGITRSLSSKAWHYLETSWQRVFGKATHRQVTEALCLLYVAMTRSRQGLYMMVQPCKAGNKRTATWLHAGLSAVETHPVKESLDEFAAALDDIEQPGTLLYRCGDPDWFEHR